MIDQGNFSKLLSDVFYKVYKVKTNLDYIRKSHIINFLDRPNKPTNNEKKDFASLMAQSVSEQSKYYKIMNVS